jgi:hypothetical protein
MAAARMNILMRIPLLLFVRAFSVWHILFGRSYCLLCLYSISLFRLRAYLEVQPLALKEWGGWLHVLQALRTCNGPTKGKERACCLFDIVDIGHTTIKKTRVGRACR